MRILKLFGKIFLVLFIISSILPWIPIHFSPDSPHIKKILQKYKIPFNLKAKEIVFHISPLQFQITVDIKKARIESENKKISFVLPNVNLSFFLSNILTRKLTLQKISLDDITFDRFQLPKNYNKDKWFNYYNNLVKAFPENLNFSFFIKDYSIKFSLIKNEGSTLEISVEQIKTKILNLKITKNTLQQFHLNIDISSIDGNNLQQLISLFNPLFNLNTPIQGYLKGTYDELSKKYDLQYQFQLEKGNFIYNKENLDIPIKQATLKGGYQKNNLSYHLDLLTNTKIQTWGDINIQGEKLNLDLSAKCNKLNVKQLLNLWPKSFAKSAYTWIKASLDKGNISQAQVNIKAHKLKSWKIKKIEGKYDIQEASILYLKNFPIISKVNSSVTFNNKTMVFKIKKGTDNHLKVSSGIVTINDLDKEDQSIEINLDTKHSLSHALMLLEKKPINFKKQSFIQDIKAQCNTKIKFIFPLYLKLKGDEIKITANGSMDKMKGIIAHSLLKKLNFSGDNIQFSYTNKQFKINGKTNVNQIPSFFSWKKNIVNDKGQLIWDFSATQEDLNRLGVTKKIIEKGNININLNFSEKLKMKILFNNAVISLLPSFSTSTSYLQIECDIPKNSIPNKFKMEVYLSEQLNFISDTTLDKNYELHSLSIESGNFYGSQLQGKCQKYNNEYSLFLTGNNFNLDFFFDDFKQDFPNLPIKINCHVNSISYKNKIIANNSSLALNLKNKINYLKMQGYLPIGKNKKFVFIFQTLPEEKQIKAYSDGISILQSLFFPKIKIQGSSFNIEIVKKKSKDFWYGNIKAKNISFPGIPEYTKILSLLSPFGIVDLLRSVKGYSFSNFSTKIKITPSIIQLIKGETSNLSLGLTFQGIFYKENKQLNIEGDILPLYMMNKIVSMLSPLPTMKIAYYVTGPFSKPKFHFEKKQQKTKSN